MDNNNNFYKNSQQNNFVNNYNKNTNNYDNVSMVCGILSIVFSVIGWFCCIGYVGIVLSIIAIVFGVMSKNNNGGVFTKEAKTGFITGIVGIGVLIIGFVIGFVIGFAFAMSGF